MSTFDPRRILLECGTKPLGEGFKVSSEGGVELYRKILPFHCAAWNRGIFFQTVLLEFDFKALVPHHALKASFCLTAADEQNRKRIRGYDGSTREFPVFTFYIVVNRGLFPALEVGEDSVEWFTGLTARTKAIAHEIRYAEQYAIHYDWALKKIIHGPVIPTVEMENQLLCPFDVIERLLHQVEQTYGFTIGGDTEFIGLQTTSAIQAYYRLWLENFAVERDVCHERTLEYLQTNFRSGGNAIAMGALQKAATDNQVSLDELSDTEFMLQAAKKTKFYKDFIASVQNSVDLPSIGGEQTILVFACRCLHQIKTRG